MEVNHPHLLPMVHELKFDGSNFFRNCSASGDDFFDTPNARERIRILYRNRWNGVLLHREWVSRRAFEWLAPCGRLGVQFAELLTLLGGFPTGCVVEANDQPLFLFLSHMEKNEIGLRKRFLGWCGG